MTDSYAATDIAIWASRWCPQLVGSPSTLHRDVRRDGTAVDAGLICNFSEAAAVDAKVERKRLTLVLRRANWAQGGVACGRARYAAERD